MDRYDIFAISFVVGVSCAMSALLSAALMSHNWADGCRSYCEPFAMDRGKTFENRVCYCMGENK